MKKYISTFLALLLFLFLVKPVFAQEGKVNIYFFWAKGCPHCHKEMVFLETLAEKYPQIEIKDYEVTLSGVKRGDCFA